MDEHDDDDIQIPLALEQISGIPPGFRQREAFDIWHRAVALRNTARRRGVSEDELSVIEMGNGFYIG